jgi:O-methyltransferase involved in polyketide biosynthesis
VTAAYELTRHIESRPNKNLQAQTVPARAAFGSDDGWVSAGVDIVVPVTARVYHCALGGLASFRVDRELWDEIVQAYPAAKVACWANRDFVRRAVEHFLDAGIRQFVDLGAGLPADSGTVHEWVHGTDPGGRIFYVDIDPVAVEVTNHQLAETANAWAICGDLRHPDSYLPHLADRLDLGEPVAVLAAAVLHNLPDQAEAAAILQQIADEVVNGSYLALTHAAPETTAARQDQQNQAVRLYERTPTPITLRTASQITALLGDAWTPLPPVVTNPDRWIPEPDGDDRPACPPSLLAAIARRTPHPYAVGQALAG